MAAASEPPAAGRRAQALLDEARRTPPVVDRASGHRCERGTHSRLATGLVVCWSPPPVEGVRFAVDAELAAQPVPEHLGRRWRGRWGSSLASFWGAWCASEVCAKLADVPIVVLAAAGPVGPSPVTIDQHTITYAVTHHDDLVLAYGVLAS
ncbi:hypothetical protein ACOCJ4_05030 [Knoellia sp. CPCC 206435]|uniref:hypothetical protein n=1 Tax=Knoellia terrae TaxID=3404797 RepID=UPI003B438D49